MTTFGAQRDRVRSLGTERHQECPWARRPLSKAQRLACAWPVRNNSKSKDRMEDVRGWDGRGVKQKYKGTFSVLGVLVIEYLSNEASASQYCLCGVHVSAPLCNTDLGWGYGEVCSLSRDRERDSRRERASACVCGLLPLSLSFSFFPSLSLSLSLLSLLSLCTGSAQTARAWTCAVACAQHSFRMHRLRNSSSVAGVKFVCWELVPQQAGRNSTKLCSQKTGGEE